MLKVVRMTAHSVRVAVVMVCFGLRIGHQNKEVDADENAVKVPANSTKVGATEDLAEHAVLEVVENFVGAPLISAMLIFAGYQKEGLLPLKE